MLNVFRRSFRAIGWRFMVCHVRWEVERGELAASRSQASHKVQ